MWVCVHTCMHACVRVCVCACMCVAYVWRLEDNLKCLSFLSISASHFPFSTSHLPGTRGLWKPTRPGPTFLWILGIQTQVCAARVISWALDSISWKWNYLVLEVKLSDKLPARPPQVPGFPLQHHSKKYINNAIHFQILKNRKSKMVVISR